MSAYASIRLSDLRYSLGLLREKREEWERLQKRSVTIAVYPAMSGGCASEPVHAAHGAILRGKRFS